MAGVEQLQSERLTLDLFEPPQRARIRLEAVRLSELKFDQREIAPTIPEKPTKTAVFKAIALDRMMREQALHSSYVMLTEPPGDYTKCACANPMSNVSVR